MTLTAHTRDIARTSRHARLEPATESPDRSTLGIALIAALVAAVPAVTVSGSVLLGAGTALSVFGGVLLAALMI